MNLILFGAPGAGKGTQAEIISEKLSIPTISTGNIIRDAMKKGTEMGIKAKAAVESGKLVSDDVVIGIIRDRLQEDDCKTGFILDGFPRTIPQAEALDALGVKIDCVLDIDVKDETIAARLGGRRVCPACGASYHLDYKKPSKDGICDACGAELIQRKDDAPETVLDRLAIYHSLSEPLKGYYQTAGKLKTVAGQEEVADTTKLVFEALGI